MKRRQIVKWLMLIAFTLMATMASADVPIPRYQALPRSEWENRCQQEGWQNQQGKVGQWQEKILQADKSIMVASLIVSMIGVLVCVYVWIRKRKYVVVTAVALLLVAIVVLVLLTCGKSEIETKYEKYEQTTRKDGGVVTVAPKSDETYEQYLERVMQLYYDESKKDRRQRQRYLNYDNETSSDWKMWKMSK